MNVKQEAENWLIFAVEDLESAKSLFSSGHFMHVCFHSQQCVEKGLKSLLILNGFDNIRTHNLLALTEQIKDIYPEIGDFREQIKIIDGYYISTRYPNGALLSEYPKIFTEEDAKQAVDLAEKIISFIKSKFDEGK